MAEEKTLIIIRGLSGSGKTTIADLICSKQADRIAISVDDFFYDEDDDYVFESARLKEAHEWCLNETETCVKEGFITIVVHNTFTRRWEVEPYIALAAKHDYRISVLSLHDRGLSDYQLVAHSPHDVPLGSIRHQRKRWESDVFRTHTRFMSR